MNGLTKLYGLMALAVCVYLAVVRGHWVVLPVAAGIGLLTIIAGRLLGKSIRGSRRGSRWPLFASLVTWLLLVTVTFLAGVAVVGAI